MDLKLHRNFPQELEADWNALLAESSVHVPFLRYEYLKTWWQTRGGGEWGQDAQPVIVTAHEGGRLVGIAPLFCARWEEKDTLLLLGSIEISDYLDLIARPEELEGFCAELLAFLLTPEGDAPTWDCIDLYNVLDSSPTISALQKTAAMAGLKFGCEAFRPALTISLPGDWEQYLAGIDKKQRHEIRRKMRRASSGEQSVRWYFADDPALIDQQTEEFMALMAQDPEKARFLTPSMRENFRNTIRCAFDAGCLHLSFLEVGGKKAAAYFSFDYLEQLWVYNSGMDSAYNEYSPGWVLLGELLKWANENGRKAFDFMRGDEDYKIRFGSKQRDVMRVTVRR
jgi:CelD/BcsL family acetyltransferase involved in cellulose biosynthesis